ncbi:MAG: hypothetical protein Q4C58_04035 [Eubacteriales bacterium]|nr:hypothetical protein [Eubacteriales bacterium]
MNRSMKNIALLLCAVLLCAFSIWGPETLARYRDKKVFDEIHEQAVEEEGAGYRYTLSSNERLYILSECLNRQTQPESEQNALIRSGGNDLNYQDLGGAYAFVVNYKGPSGKEITDEEIYETCNRGIQTLIEQGILPDTVKNVEASAYEAVLYSAIDVLEPRNNVAVWKVSLSDSQKNADKSNRLIDAYIDADNGRIYEFYVRTQLDWTQIDPDAVVEAWRTYMRLEAPADYESDNPLLETTPYFKKYVFEGMDGANTVVTVGFYEGINELFLKISK